MTRSLLPLAGLLLSVLASVPSPSALADSAAATIPSSGSITLTTEQLSEHRFLLTVDVNVDDAVAVLVTTPGEELPLLRIELEDWAAAAKATFGEPRARARLTVSGDDLKGHMEHVLDYDGEALEDLVVSLLTRDGKVHPLNIHSPGLGQGQEHRLDVRSSP